MNIQGKVVVITGASSGIGRAAALRFAREKARVALAARNEPQLLELKAQIEAEGNTAMVCVTDVRSQSQVQSMVREVMAAWGRLDVLIANAGILVRGRIADAPLEAFEKSFSINFFGALNIIRAALPIMRAQSAGHIIIINSLDTSKPVVGQGPYSVAKSALNALGDALRQELSGTGITVSSVFPGRVDTPMVQNLQVPWISPKISPDRVVDAIFRCLGNRRAFIVVPFLYYPVGLLNLLVPRILDWCYARLGISGKEIGR